MKRSASSPPTKAKLKRKRIQVPDYHLATSVTDANGNSIWPAPEDRMVKARDFITECAQQQARTLIVPDKDADGLASGAIIYRTLTKLGLAEHLIDVHLLEKGNTISTEAERQAMQERRPRYVYILDQGSRKAPPVIDAPHKALVIDHHYADEGDCPEGAEFVTACHSPPVATSSLLTYIICADLHKDIASQCDWLCILGTHGDLGNTLKWEAPFPDMKPAFKKYSKKALNDAVSLINAPRRTAAYDVISAWKALNSAAEPFAILKNQRLLAARAEVNAEVERCTHTAPKFSSDARIAVFRISSPCQVHPVIATRWAGHLQSPRLEVVLVANDGYLPGQVNFSCRIPRCARARETQVNIIEVLREVAGRSSTGLLGRLGENFARGHKEASGGIVGKDEFEELLSCMRVGEKNEKTDGSPKKPRVPATQTNTLLSYFGKKQTNMPTAVESRADA